MPDGDPLTACVFDVTVSIDCDSEWTFLPCSSYGTCQSSYPGASTHSTYCACDTNRSGLQCQNCAVGFVGENCETSCQEAKNCEAHSVACGGSLPNGDEPSLSNLLWIEIFAGFFTNFLNSLMVAIIV